MGCFDSVYAACPAPGCGGQVEFQSKGGSCSMSRYEGHDVPIDVAGDCTYGWCEKCGESWDAILCPPRVVVIAGTRTGEDE